MSSYWVYILTNCKHGTLYIGVTNNLIRRVAEHKQKQIEGFTKRYHLTRLVYFEEALEIQSAITREKQLKGWIRQKKIELIQVNNPDWRDLFEDLLGYSE